MKYPHFIHYFTQLPVLKQSHEFVDGIVEKLFVFQMKDESLIAH